MSCGLVACRRQAPAVRSAAVAAEVSTPGKWIPGVHYEALSRRQPIASKAGHVEVAEFFSYECPHCYTLENHLVLWNLYFKRDEFTFFRIPDPRSATGRAYATLYYTLQGLARDDLHHEVFDSIYRLRNPLVAKSSAQETLQLQLAFASAHGIRREDFSAMCTSPEVAANIERAIQLANEYHIDSVPTVIINGRYSTGPSRTDGNEQQVMMIINDLIALEQDRHGRAA
jgi:thiol:disulfide interchange protein DsbA